MEKCEVTFEQYAAFCFATCWDMPDVYDMGRGKIPVINVSLYDAQAFCDWLSEKTGKIGICQLKQFGNMFDDPVLKLPLIQAIA